jgi:hypothetical protein
MLSARMLLPARSDDIFLFDLFRDSECDAEWRVVAHAVQERWNGRAEDLDPDTAAAARGRRAECARRCMPLDEHAHGRLLLELQLLYVALSRGRRRAFVFDRDTEKREPMFAFLGSPVSGEDGTVSRAVAVFDDVADGADASDSEEDAEAGAAAVSKGILSASLSSDWQTTGAALLANGLHAPAARAFFAAGDVDGGWRATGAALALAAETAAGLGQEAKQRALHLQAAQAFQRGRAYADAAANLRAAGETQLADALTAPHS